MTPAAPTAAQPDVVTELKELASLRERGALSPEEFQAAKDKLLAR